MKHRYFSIFVSLVFFICINLLSVGEVFACYCEPPAVCQAYSRAKAVFIGTAEKIEINKYELRSPVKVTFSVERTFKGKTEKIETAEFGHSDCATMYKFKLGEKYFVYKEEPFHLCNLTRPLSTSRFNLEYAESLSEANPIFSIMGAFSGLAKDDAKNIQVTIEKGQTKYKPDINDYGSFKFKATETGVYLIKIMLPFEAQINPTPNMVGNILPDTAKISSTPLQTTLEYDAEFKPNECDVKFFDVFRVNKSLKPTSLKSFLKTLINNFPNEMNKNLSALRPA